MDNFKDVYSINFGEDFYKLTIKKKKEIFESLLSQTTNMKQTAELIVYQLKTEEDINHFITIKLC